MSTVQKKSRSRLTAEEARERILDAAELLVADGGPEAMRLQEVADAAEASISNVLYHFGSRAGLLEALFQRAALRFRETAMSLMQDPDVGFGASKGRERLVRLFDLVADPARARIFGAVIAAGGEPFPDPFEKGLRAVAESIHAGRERWFGSRAPLRDSLYLFEFGVLAMFGELVVGDLVRKRLGLPTSARERRRFRSWVADRLISLGAHKRSE